MKVECRANREPVLSLDMPRQSYLRETKIVKVEHKSGELVRQLLLRRILSSTKIVKVEHKSGKLVWLLLLRRILSSIKTAKSRASE